MTFTPPAAQDLTGKVALITGTTSGLGKRFAQILANAGASVVITGRRVDRLEALAAELEGMGARVLPVALDVTDVASIDACVAEVVTELGGIDILINNAGMNVQASAVDLLPEDFDRVMDTNMRGAFFMATRVGARMIARGQGGSIINVASIGAHTVLPGLATYCMSKAAVAMMTRSLAHEWARHKINVNAICPGFIETELNSEWFETDGGQKQIKSWPRRRLGLESDLDGIVLLLASEQGRLMTGSVTTIDDGQSL
ncbi:MAG: SDR family NAD(P)-dependent oxidoreductase [Alphaproteobacteria bacterium]|mgnify:FL=1|nr:short-chain dehydrogenase [Rhodobiaceae bacterium]MBO6542138.1 SDR family NAD(P)-dependent oxidoreductase [Alphaproteobacteria bacterium]MBO6629707.1 SDR family NAD(P)-dependent oxidoreductase [Alphaproteobacteria bacterium]MDF1625004.1 SDR family oxidoreductase [Parvibaculaceae bacterium]|tara:strand:+ start:772 stop:1542 length:771 start_codon:yes stop_codon:yes gene_type:complete